MQKYQKRIRDICHGVKECDPIAINEMADYFINLDIINADSILIPAPNHQGFAIYTKQIADIIAENTGAIVNDILKCLPHETLYHQKKTGKIHKPVMYLTKKIETEKQIYFLDNVIDTGTTYYAANRLLGGRMNPLVFAMA